MWWCRELWTEGSLASWPTLAEGVATLEGVGALLALRVIAFSTARTHQEGHHL